ncbi:MAG: DUF2520 domain-containing protein [Clostridia bacterium]|nr:DUF2520 domain-containing protein [Clostridia bacterium]
MKIGFIGAGKVGSSLGKYLSVSGNVAGYFSRSENSSRAAASFTSSKFYQNVSSLVSECDVIFVTTPDGVVADVWEQLKTLSISGKTICHCSGSLSSQVFEGIEQTGAYAMSVHPLQAISDREKSVHLLKGCIFTIEGDERKIDEIKSFFESFGNIVKTISAKDKTLYHAAAVFVSNLPIALTQVGVDILMRCGFDYDSALKALAPLIVGSATNAAQKGAVNALTGPVERGDTETVSAHLGVISESEREIYLLLTNKLVDVASEKNPDRDYTELKKILEE